MVDSHDPMCDWLQTICTTETCPGLRMGDHCEHEWCQCALIAKVRADERSRIADAVAELMIAHPYEYPSDYAEADREWIRAGCPRDAINALKEKP